MSDIRYNQWLHNSGTGGVSQDAGGNIGIGTTAPLIPVGAGNTAILNVGVVTATTYYGDAANLTGLTAGQIPNLAASKITSGTVATARLGSGTANNTTFLRGDQSWQAVTTTTVNNNADNRVITGGSGTNIYAESNLTFDGSTLALDSSTGTINVSRNSRTLTLEGNYGNEGHPAVKTSSGHDLRIFTNGNNEKLRITSDGKILVGHSTARIVSTSVNAFNQIEGTTYHQSALSITRNTDDQWGGYVIIGKSRGTDVGGIGTVTDNDIIGEFRFAACDGEDMAPVAALIRGEIDGAVGINSTPGALTFRTTSAGNLATTERLRIKSDGDIVATGNLKTNNLPGNNLIHNGEFAIWQRGTTSIYSSQNKYLADRFKFVSNSDGNGSVHQHTNVPTIDQTGGSKFAYSLRLNCTTADTSLANNQYVNLSTRIEGRDLRHLGFGQAGTRYATLSFWQRSPNGTYHVSFRNNAYNRYYIASYTAANNTWEKHELTIPIDTSGTWTTDHSAGVDITWSLGGGSWYNQGTVGSWQGGSSHAGSSQKNFFDTVGNDFYITGVQFEKGTIATPFEHKSYGEDLRICQRYFYTITPPVGFINATEDLGIAFTSSANEVQFPITFPVEMRATPSIEQVTGSNYFIIGFGNLGGDKYLSGSWIVNNMSPNGGNLYTDPDSNLSSYIGQAAGIQLKNTSARLALRSDL